jgi:peptide-methionine (S)-S-oxide reductase
MSRPKITRTPAALFLLPLILIGLAWEAPRAAEAPTIIAAPAIDQPKAAGPLQTAVFAGGCFWGTQGVFEHVRGVHKVVSGYAGGEKSTARYGDVSMGGSGHAESIQITYDPAQVSYGELLQVFFSVAHDPTQLNRQGPDSGTQYRSAVFYGDDMQKNVAQHYVAQLNQSHAFKKPIVTSISPLKGFYPAEGYHQDFLFFNPTYPYIVINDLPKIENLKRLLPAHYVAEPATLSKARDL